MKPKPSTLRSALLAVAAAALAAAPLPAQKAPQANAPVSKNAAAAAPDSPFHGEVVEDIIARVNDRVIGTSDYNRAETELDQAAKQRNLTPVDVAEQKRQLLRDLIDNQLLLSKGKQLGITGEAETIRQLDELRKQNNLDSMEALEKAAEQQGVSFADFRASIQNRAITTQVIRDEVGRRINITSADEQNYYRDHQDQFTTPEQVKLSEILIPTANPDDAGQVAEAQKKADELHAQLAAGKDFAALAKANSTGSTAADGGTLGDFKRGQLAGVLEDAVFPLPAGGYSAPIRTKQGFVILKVDGHTPSGVQPFAQVQAQVEDAVGSAKVQPALRAYLTRLREEAFIDIKPGFVDAAASKDETRPIFSAYAPPQPKKKKAAVARTRYQGSARNRNIARQQLKNEPAPPPAPSANVPSLADVPSTAAAGAPAPAATAPPPAAPVTANATPPAAPSGGKGIFGRGREEVASAPEPQKREVVRFGQAPSESLPAGSTKGEDAGASPANGNGSATETETAASQNPNGNQVNSNIRFANGESASDQQTVVEKKTRFSDRAQIPKAVKRERERKSKQDPFPTAAPDAQEVADKSTQAKPLGLKGDTSIPSPKPKPTGGKTRYADEAGKPKPSPDANPGVGSDLAPPPAQPQR